MIIYVPYKGFVAGLRWSIDGLVLNYVGDTRWYDEQAAVSISRNMAMFAVNILIRKGFYFLIRKTPSSPIYNTEGLHQFHYENTLKQVLDTCKRMIEE